MSMPYRKVSAQNTSFSVAITSIQTPGELNLFEVSTQSLSLLYNLKTRGLERPNIVRSSVTLLKKITIDGMNSEKLIRQHSVFTSRGPSLSKAAKTVFLSACKFPLNFCSLACARFNDVSPTQQILGFWKLLLNGNGFKTFQGCIFSRVQIIKEETRTLYVSKCKPKN